MSGFLNAGASLCDFLPIGWALSLGRIPRRPKHDPFWASVTDEPERGVDSRVTLPGHQLPPVLSKVITNDLDREVLNLPIAHLDLLVADESERVYRPTGICVHQPHPPTSGVQVPAFSFTSMMQAWPLHSRAIMRRPRRVPGTTKRPPRPRRERRKAGSRAG